MPFIHELREFSREGISMLRSILVLIPSLDAQSSKSSLSSWPEVKVGHCQV